MANWWHRFFNPHCEKCREEYCQEITCEYCEEYRTLLETERASTRKLLDSMIAITESILHPESSSQPVTTREEPKAILPKIMPWAVKRQQLEAQDRERAKALQREAEMAIASTKSTEELERELLGEEA